MVLTRDDHSITAKLPNRPSTSQDCDFATKNLKNFLSNAGIFDRPQSINDNFIIDDHGSRTNFNNHNNTRLNTNYVNILEDVDTHSMNRPIKYYDKMSNRSQVYAGSMCRELSTDQSLMPFINGKYITNDSKELSNGLTSNKHNGIRGRKYVGNKFTPSIPNSPDNHYALPVYMRAPAPKSVPIPKNLFKN